MEGNETWRKMRALTSFERKPDPRGQPACCSNLTASERQGVRARGNRAGGAQALLEAKARVGWGAVLLFAS
jgi:hypothetical protein